MSDAGYIIRNRLNFFPNINIVSIASIKHVMYGCQLSILFHIFKRTKWVVSFRVRGWKINLTRVLIRIKNWKNLSQATGDDLSEKSFDFFIVVASVSFVLTLVLVDVMVAHPQVYYRNYREIGCPEFNQHTTVHRPHPVYCNKYLTCLSKSVLLQSCPSNLHWNIEKNMCDYPEEAKCVDVTVHYNRISRRSRFK